ncbi:HAD family hydrolase [uncultured Winogradskyella sp.]|uniref:HAD family hydrolase n=1 Tax=uncultured Winogradskyella sp. TaxID=395353 RepID=UPI00262FD03A|nr:HAD family hydrolase [uncultured Winogradskyella sp.]
MPNYKCVIFDCDGVLVDSEPISNQVMVDLANLAGANIDIDYAYHHFKGNSLQNCMIKITDLIGKEMPFDFEYKFRKQSFEAFKHKIQPIKGVKTVLQNLEVPFCVASSGPVNKIKLNLELTGLISFFKETSIFSCYTVNKWKPDPTVFLWAAETMGFSPKDCLVVEDSPIGVQAAVKGGFDVFGFTAHDYKNELQSMATKTFDDMLKLSLLINS